uniref:Transmembrane protein n=1 Tax=Ditylenchus dipsaci TaxID=166011 RepID=A0A915ER09_9BILA
MVFDKIVNSAKNVADVLKGAATVLTSPNQAVPSTKVHPRMPAWPMTLPEYIRMQPWRYMWMYTPGFRLYVFSSAAVAMLFIFGMKSSPSQQVQQKKAAEDAHHHHVDMFLHKSQKAADQVYFEKHDPLRHTRPHAYSMVYSGGH